jgi:parallel beta-helix repeat protein
MSRNNPLDEIVVQISHDGVNGCGTGFYISETRIATCYHNLVDKGNELQEHYWVLHDSWGGKWIKAIPIKEYCYPDPRDTAILQSEKSIDGKLTIKCNKWDGASNEFLTRGYDQKKAYGIGATTLSGEIIAITTYKNHPRLQLRAIEGSIQPGRSGSPIWAKEQEAIVGLISFQAGYESKNFEMPLAIPIRDVFELVPITGKTVRVGNSFKESYASIQEAIDGASPGDAIIIEPGCYYEELIVEKPLVIIGDDEVEGQVQLIANKGNTNILFKATIGHITNLALKQKGLNDYCVDIQRGKLFLETCDIYSEGLGGIISRPDTDSVISCNKIHNCKSGIIYDASAGIFENNDLFENELAGITIRTNGNPLVRNNKIYNGKSNGVYVSENGRGILENNDIFGNNRSGVAIDELGDPVLRGNQIHDNNASGVHVRNSGKGILEKNNLFQNKLAGITIRTDGNPSVRNNKIYNGKSNGVYVSENGRGILEENEILANALNGVEIRLSSKPIIRYNKINKNSGYGLIADTNIESTTNENEIEENIRGKFKIEQ